MKKIINPVLNARLLKFPWGDICQGFGENIALYQKAIGINGHNGINIIKPEGTPILATTGVVCEVKDTPEGYGKHIRILTLPDENKEYFELTYGHLKDIYVKIGDRVEDGQEIGTLGNTGFVISGNTVYWGSAPAGKGYHLHFGTRACSEYNTGWQAIYSTGYTAFIKNYEDRQKGSIDPMLFLDVPEDITAKIEILKRLVAALAMAIQMFINKK